MKPSAYQPNSPGIFRMPAYEYHAAPGVSKHALDYVHECPKKYILYKKHGLQATESMKMGTLLHTAVLEPDNLPGSYYVRPDKFKTGEKQAWELAHADKPSIKADEVQMLQQIRNACVIHPILGPILESEGEVELSCFAQCPQTGLIRKGRPDLITEDTGGQLWIVDLKFVADAGKDSFQRQSQDLRYFVQAAYYIDLLELLGFPGARFLFAAVEKDPIHPDDHQHIVRCFEIPPADIENARGHYIRDLHRFKQCLDSGEWPDDTDKIQSLEMSSYYRKANAI